jgi:hypothetical protein
MLYDRYRGWLQSYLVTQLQFVDSSIQALSKYGPRSVTELKDLDQKTLVHRLCNGTFALFASAVLSTQGCFLLHLLLQQC